MNALNEVPRFLNEINFEIQAKVLNLLPPLEQIF